MSGSWYVDRGLEVLIEEVKAKFPGVIVGTIGDKPHQGEASDHNPSTAKHDKGAVDAADFMIGKDFTFANAQWLTNALVRFKDRRIGYIIWNGQIISSTVKPWVWRKYTGKDPHTNHVHVSVNDLHETDSTLWTLEEKSNMADDPRSWDSPQVLAINFFFAEAFRAAKGEAQKEGPGDDRNARNAFTYLKTIINAAQEETAK